MYDRNKNICFFSDFRDIKLILFWSAYSFQSVIFLNVRYLNNKLLKVAENHLKILPTVKIDEFKFDKIVQNSLSY